jgi:hypothetical protein
MREYQFNRPGGKARALRTLFSLAVAVLFVAAGITVWAGGPRRAFDDQDNDWHDGHHEGDRDPYAFGLWGDLPYSTTQRDPGIPNLIDDMNSQDLAFTVHDGDLKQGNGLPICSDALYSDALGYFNTLHAPAIFTPGDNDWTDCDRPNNGSFNSLERLDHERQVFFSTPFSFGRHRLRQEVQAEPKCLGVNGLVPCVENRRWTVGGVTYATLNIQGSCNNLCGDGFDPVEWGYRNAADIAWMQDTFTEAKKRHSAAVMFISQADPGFNSHPIESEPVRNAQTLDLAPGVTDGFKEFLVALRDEVIAFQRPVAYVHGDTHYFRIDKPFLNSLGQRLENFTRVETFGDNAANGTNDVNWVKVYVHPRSREVFSFQPQIVPANRVAVPAP